MQGTRSVRDFLRAVSTTAPEFATYWSNDILKSQRAGQQTGQAAGQQAGQQAGQTAPDLYEIVEHFRDHRRHLAATKEAQSAAFSITPPEPQPQPEKTPEKRDCLYGEQHRFKDCPYLISDKQPEGWKPDPAIQERIETKLQNLRLKVAVEHARASQKKDIPEDIEKIETF